MNVASEVPIVEIESPSHGDEFVTVQHTKHHSQASLDFPTGASMIKRIALGIFALALVLAALAYAFRQQVAMRLMERVVAENMRSSLIDELPDGLHLVLCGAGSPLPDVERSGPCAAVIAGKKLYVVDSGAGSSRVLARSRLQQGVVDAVLLTHFHSDHIDGLGELMLQRWAGGGNREPMPVYGPSGVERVIAGFNEAYAQDFG